jgi:hypothetical protein
MSPAAKTPKARLSIGDLMTLPELLGPRFADASWAVWFAVLMTAHGHYQALTSAQQVMVRSVTGRTRFPTVPFWELVLQIGRRAGKSVVAALEGIYRAVFCAYPLAPGERGIVMILAADKRQARVIFRYIRAMLTSTPMLAALMRHETKESISLTNGVDIEVQVSSYRSVRGFTVVAAICDEIAFWQTDESGADPDSEVLNALRPAMATVPGALLVLLSSPYAPKGELYRAYERSYGKDDDHHTLVVKAPTWVMNPLLPRDHPTIARAFAEDEARANAEYAAEYRSDVENLFSREVVDACVVPGRYELPPLRDLDYLAFVDPSGGSKDAFTLAIGHRDHATGRRVVDAVRITKPPFAPSEVVKDYAALLNTYRIHQVSGDRYAGEWPREQFRRHGIEYEPSPLPASDLYRELLPCINGGTVELLAHADLRKQLIALERHTGRSGRDRIDHAPNAHDDLANAVAGVVHLLAQERAPLLFR